MFYRWHPQLALRYLPIVAWLKQHRLADSHILEVGSGSLGIGPYLNKPFTGVDVDFAGPQWPQMKKIKGRAQKLPFPDKAFDVVISVDVLEHLPPADRPKAVNELFRVATKAVVIAVPCGAASHAQDRDLSLEYQRKFGKQFAFLQEHLQYGLPTHTQVMTWINQPKVERQGNRNLDLRRWLMAGWMTKNPLADFFFRKLLLVFLPLLFILDRRPPYYRQVFFVKIN